VRYVIQLDDAGKGFTYTLPELAQALDLPALDGDLPEATRKLARPAQYRKVQNPGSAPLRTHGAQVMNALRAEALLTLQTHRGGFLKRGMKYPDGSTSPGRRFMLTLYLDFLRGSKLDPAAALTALRAMAANMIPPWPDEPGDPTPETLIEAEYSKAKRRRWLNKKLCPLLGITADLARQLDLKTIRPLDVTHEADQARPLQADMIQARREFARQHIEAHGSISARRLARLYKAAGHPGANQQTANQDLLSILGPDRYHKGGRPRKAAL
jgi:hypothetical protein